MALSRKLLIEPEGRLSLSELIRSRVSGGRFSVPVALRQLPPTALYWFLLQHRRRGLGLAGGGRVFADGRVTRVQGAAH